MLWQIDRLLCMEVKQLVGWNIRRVRQERGLTFEALAQQAHVSAAWLG
jgi:DNA-binding XRE family transcriptional regulator